MQNIKQNAWFQGALLSKSSSKKFAKENNIDSSNDDFLILVNQDCDILHTSYENEPYAEFLLAEKISESLYEGGYEKGKNPRILHFRIGVDYYKIHHHKKITLNRKILESEKPSAKFYLDDSAKIIIPRWMGKKYFRVAFPDNFNLRIKKAQKKILKTIKQNSNKIEELYIRLSTERELEETEIYKVVLLATVSDSGVDIVKIQEAVDKIASYMNSCDGIEIIDSRAEYDEEITLADVRELDIWDYYDYLSSGNEHEF